MKDNYDFSGGIKNPYIDKLPPLTKGKKQITININTDTISYFKDQAERTGIPYQTLINLYLTDCAVNNRQLHFNWS